ncbi:ribokinase [Oceanobacillus damuensis]|uniref:ribokinase n=1 Tax=Oceanobacillus damuensis TaxID=937928 RepID=UPI000A06431E|nr:ribokinase [Oceanobacillus damuensis]
MNNPTITVIGSINVDMVTTTDVLPNQGETLVGRKFHIKPGGKGANQAVAAARLGANVNMIGRVGQDKNGTDMLQVLKDENVSAGMVKTVANANTGIANILLSDRDNRIIIVPGANDEVTPQFIKQFKKEIIQSDLVLIQFEIPVETILYCLDLCYENNVPIVVNPAPAKELPYDYWLKATYITPNETEAEQLFNGGEKDSALNNRLIVTKGENGVSYYENDEPLIAPGYSVTPVDTTGAGDTFNGAFCVALSERKSLSAAIDFANAAAALSIQKFGAQGGMPTRSEVDSLLTE